MKHISKRTVSKHLDSALKQAKSFSDRDNKDWFEVRINGHHIFTFQRASEAFTYAVNYRFHNELPSGLVTVKLFSIDETVFAA